MTMPEKIPNARIGRMGDTPVAKNATEVVKLVVKIALDARKEVYCRRWDSEGSAMQVCSSSRDWWNASRYTKTSSAPIPRMTKMIKMCMKAK